MNKDTVFEILLFLVASGYVLITLQGPVFQQAAIITAVGALIMAIRAIMTPKDE